MSTNALTPAREAVWDAIDNWAPLTSAGATPIRKKFKFDDETNMLVDAQPSASDLTAFAVFPARTETEGFTNTFRKYPYVLNLTIWTRDWIPSKAEAVWWNVVEALFQSCDTGGGFSYPNTYIFRATSHVPKLGGIDMQAVKLGTKEQHVRAIKTVITIYLPLTFTPIT